MLLFFSFFSVQHQYSKEYIWLISKKTIFIKYMYKLSFNVDAINTEISYHITCIQEHGPGITPSYHIQKKPSNLHRTLSLLRSNNKEIPIFKEKESSNYL